MKQTHQFGGITVNVLLIIMLVVIGVLIYTLAGGPMPKFGQTHGVVSPSANDNEIAPTFVPSPGEFSDGLINPDFSQSYQLDEFGSGLAQRDIFDIDINEDGIRDRITRNRNENGTAHFYDEYKIELNIDGEFVDITPDGFRTTEGAECALTKIKFIFQPDFRVIKISRPWQDSWETPTMATRTTYAFNENNILAPVSSQQLKTVCDVSDLF